MSKEEKGTVNEEKRFETEINPLFEIKDEKIRQY
jgi:hypothetical protein